LDSLMSAYPFKTNSVTRIVYKVVFPTVFTP
jgi:hypothetical protein